MLSFTPTEEQKMLVDAIAKFAANDVRAVAHDADEDGALPAEVVQKGWELGLLPAGIPEAYCGFGEHSTVTNVLAAEEFGYGDLAIAMAVMHPGLVGLPVHFSGTEDQKHKYLCQLAEPTPPAFTAAFTEPGFKFDPHAPRTIAKREGDHYVLNGTKCLVPLAKDAKVTLVYARDAESGKIDGYLVDSSDAAVDGYQVCDREKLLGIRALPTYSVQMNNVKLPLSAKLGGDEGTRYDRILSHSRVALAGLAVGVARAAFEYARDYAKQRVTFGAPIATRQSIAFMLAEVATEIDAARLMAWEAAWKLDLDPLADITQESYLAKEYADKAALFATDSALQVLGGHGYIREYPVERWLRNARGFTSFLGLSIA